MSSWASWFGGKRAPPTRDATRETIVELRQHLLTMDKKEEYLNKKMEEETQKAKNALLQGGSNGEQMAKAALRQKKKHQIERDKLWGMRDTIEAQVRSSCDLAVVRVQPPAIDAVRSPSVTSFQVSAIENANMNMETMNAMKRGKDILKGIHGNLSVQIVLLQ
jgi:charged multivesicular body protein 4